MAISKEEARWQDLFLFMDKMTKKLDKLIDNSKKREKELSNNTCQLPPELEGVEEGEYIEVWDDDEKPDVCPRYVYNDYKKCHGGDWFVIVYTGKTLLTFKHGSRIKPKKLGMWAFRDLKVYHVKIYDNQPSGDTALTFYGNLHLELFEKIFKVKIKEGEEIEI